MGFSLALLPKVWRFHSPRKVVKMRHPFQVGDLVRSTMNPCNKGIVVKARKEGESLDLMWADVLYFRSGKVVEFLPLSRFIIISGAE
jgi:hypothetical protein